MSETLFTKIMAGEIPSDILYEDEHCIAIRDINPQAPVHVLLIPRQVIPRLVDAQLEDQALLGHLLQTAGTVATQFGIGDNFRLVVNNGEGAGQTVFHLHLHIMGGQGFDEGRLTR